MQNKVKEFNTNSGRHAAPMNVYARLLDVTSELGELAKEYLNGSNYGASNFIMNDDFKMEFGDVMYSLLSLACEANIDAEECLDKVIKKYQDRINKKKSMGSGN